MANYPKIKTASTVIAFDNPVSVLPDLTVTGPVTFTKSTTSQQPTWSTKITIIADGVNTPDFSAFDSIGTGVYDNTNGVKNICIFTYWGSSLYTVCITPVTVGSGSGDTTPPTVNGMVASAATSIFVTFNETVNTPSLSGWSFKKNGSTLAASAVSAVTGTVWEFTVATMASGDTITASYNSGTGSVQDLAGNPLASFTDASVSNTIGSTTLNAPTGVTLGTATSSTQPLTWTDTNSSPNENGYKVYYNTVNTFGSATLATTTAANATSYTVTGLTASTLYYYWVVAQGNGTITSDSSPSTVASGSTAGASYDTDAQTAFTAIETAEGSSLSSTVKDAYNAWVLREKAASRYTKYTHIYPFLGASAGAHAINAKAPGTNDLTFNGSGWTHTSAGIKSDRSSGTNASLGFSPNAMTQDDNHMAVYCSENIADGYAIGSYAAGAGSLAIGLIGGNAYTRDMCDNATVTGLGGVANGMQMVTRTASGSYLYVNGSSSNTVSDASDGKSTNNIMIGDLGGLTGNQYGGRLGFATVGTGFTGTEATAARTSLNTLMSDLSR